MKIINASDIEKIRIESDRLIGTNEYNKYYMATEIKSKNTWKFIGWGIPFTNVDGVIKKDKDNVYLIINDTRYKMQDVHMKLLNIE